MAGLRWCSDCQMRVDVIRGPVCEICGLPQNSSGICSFCQKEKPAYRALRSWSVFADPVQEALHRLKYRRDMALGDSLAAQMADFLFGLQWPIDIMIPVPLGKDRLRERGYNQAGLIARPLAMAAGLEYVPQGLTRQRETRSQVGLTQKERRENVRGAFMASAGRVEGRTVLLMDDVATTGSTLSSSAEALYSSGAKEVYALTVARALSQHGLVNV